MAVHVHGSLTVKCSFPIHSGMDNDLFWRFGPSENVKSQIADISKQHLFLSKLMLQIMSDGNKTKYVYCILYKYTYMMMKGSTDSPASKCKACTSTIIFLITCAVCLLSVPHFKALPRLSIGVIGTSCTLRILRAGRFCSEMF